MKNNYQNSPPRPLATLLLLLVLPGLFSMASGSSAADVADYRLTGIIGSDTGTAFAVIENADGQQQLLREGSAIGDGYVKSISSREKLVVLAFPTSELSLRLTGSGRPDEFPEEFSISDFNDNIQQKTLDPGSVEDLRILAGNAKDLSERDLNLQVNKLLGLSREARVVAYNGRGVDSTHALLQKMAAQISGLREDASYLGSIAVSDENGRRREYLSSGQSEPK